jgi:murein DD-endopeptidase MepM/ murein hydrolase activator NlpD
VSGAVVALLVSALFATVAAASDLRDWKLLFPVPETYRAHLTDSFAERRGNRPHEAVDILAPRNTPVRAVDNGRIAKLFYSEAGGNTIYQFDITERYAFYYAHLERYADGLVEGQRVSRGQVIGYVGTSGNAPTDTPHLHFAIFRLTAEKQWWVGTPIDPYPLLR